MLIPDFYHIEELNKVEGELTATIKLNANHAVYSGHFPDQPVVPGVVQLQIIKELLEEALQCQLLLAKMSSAKYLRMVIPETNNKLTCSINYRVEEDGVKIAAVIKEKDLVFTKIKAFLSRV